MKKHVFHIVLTIALLSIIGNILMYYRFSTLRPLVSVGDRTISKREYLAVLDEAAGKAVLSKMVYGELIRQAAAKAGVMPTDQDVDARIAQMQQRNPNLVAATPPWDLRQSVTTAIAFENLRIQHVSASDAEVAQFYAAHRRDFQQQGQMQAGLIVANDSADAQTVVHLLQQNISPQVIGKQPIFHVVGYQGYTIDLKQPSRRGIVKSIFAMKTGDIHVFPLGGQYLVVRVFHARPAGPAPLSAVRDQVARLVRLQKAPSAKQTLVALYHGNTPTFEISKYGDFFSDVAQANVAQAPTPTPAQKTASVP